MEWGVGPCSSPFSRLHRRHPPHDTRKLQLPRHTARRPGYSSRYTDYQYLPVLNIPERAAGSLNIHLIHEGDFSLRLDPELLAPLPWETLPLKT